jgi:Fe-S-cluster-containing dehydrogenase component
MVNCMPEYGLLIDYEYCTGCHACEVACKQEYRLPAGKWGGIKVIEMIQELPGNQLYITYYLSLLNCAFSAFPALRRGFNQLACSTAWQDA